MEIKTKNFILRHPKLSDAKGLFECEQDNEARKNFMSTPKSITEVRDSLKNRKSDEEKLIIDIDGEVAGWINIHSLDRDSLTKKGAVGIIGWCTHPKFRGMGIMSKAAKLSVNYFFKKYKLKRISARCRSFNKASARIAEKIGFTLEGIHKKEVYKNGEYYDNMYWAKVK